MAELERQQQLMQHLAFRGTEETSQKGQQLSQAWQVLPLTKGMKKKPRQKRRASEVLTLPRGGRALEEKTLPPHKKE
eukprot:12208419-Prorocentrum_lima.AAC.1